MAFINLKKCLNDPKQLIKLIVLVICVCITIYQKYGLGFDNVELANEKGFARFPFDKYTIEEFLQETTYQRNEITYLYGYGGEGHNPVIELNAYYLLGKGLCHNFLPRENSRLFSITGGFYFYFSHNAKSKERDVYGWSTSGFEVYIHDHNQILNGEVNDENSFMDHIYLESAEDMHVSLTLQVYSQLSSSQDPCNSDPSYSRSQCHEDCFHNQIAANVGCTLPWLRNLKKEYPQCNNVTAVQKVVKDLNSARQQYLKNCVCIKACNITVYTSRIQNRKDAPTLLAPASALNIYFSSNLITTMEEVISYDWNNFVSDMGGSLGFLLGLSVIGVLTMLEQIFRLVFRKNKKTNDDHIDTTKNVLEEEGILKIIQFLTNYSIYEEQLTAANKDDVIKY